MCGKVCTRLMILVHRNISGLMAVPRNISGSNCWTRILVHRSVSGSNCCTRILVHMAVSVLDG